MNFLKNKMAVMLAGAVLAMSQTAVTAQRFLFRIASNLLRDRWRRPASQCVELPLEIEAADAQQGNDARLLLFRARRRMLKLLAT